MDQKTALKRLGVSRKTLIKYRKELGIFEETKKNITEGQLMRLTELRDRNRNLTNYTQLQFEAKAAERPGVDVLRIEPTDSAQIRKLKEQYNRYSRFLDFLGEEVLDVAIERKSLPPKDISLLIEKYQSLQIKVAKELRHAQQNGDDIGALIADKLKAYG